MRFSDGTLVRIETGILKEYIEKHKINFSSGDSQQLGLRPYGKLYSLC